MAGVLQYIRGVSVIHVAVLALVLVPEVKSISSSACTAGQYFKSGSGGSCEVSVETSDPT